MRTEHPTVADNIQPLPYPPSEICDGGRSGDCIYGTHMLATMPSSTPAHSLIATGQTDFPPLPLYSDDILLQELPRHAC